MLRTRGDYISGRAARSSNLLTPTMDVTEKQIKEKETEVQSIQKKLASPFHFPGKKEELEAKLRSLIAEMEGLRKWQAGLIAIFNADDVHSADDLRARMEENKPKYLNFPSIYDIIP